MMVKTSPAMFGYEPDGTQLDFANHLKGDEPMVALAAEIVETWQALAGKALKDGRNGTDGVSTGELKTYAFALAEHYFRKAGAPEAAITALAMTLDQVGLKGKPRPDPGVLAKLGQISLERPDAFIWASDIDGFADVVGPIEVRLFDEFLKLLPATLDGMPTGAPKSGRSPLLRHWRTRNGKSELRVTWLAEVIGAEADTLRRWRKQALYLGRRKHARLEAKLMLVTILTDGTVTISRQAED